ncbi:tRNA pseudouridine(38-40) synthase TruA [Chromatocurvus halotolerans]|uniref:tRNA pseudouridine synthase A n=1 Tax=Chromatocurvus halotolerans TaxID=1132028 RepID=A0A4R2KND5_9GAMM|nr:tRNA pseudouridine(38-40) synthase TruA [Chromatocurvus halotolerans]TCO75671.1 tRNA pseudouridine38-40 synthase [Chromatocurvus halotolerans]
MADNLFSQRSATAAGDIVACCVEYDGSGYSGWQSQSGVATVQDSLENALSRVANQPLRVHCAGRTDTGVHAAAQWIHFVAPCERGSGAWVRGGNANLPGDIRLLHAATVATDFHARHSALARHYRYIIANTPVASALYRDRATWIREPLDAPRMHEAAQVLVGEQDFSAFRAASCQSRTAMRCVHRVSVRRSGPLVAIDISANAFLHHMVRNIAGTLVAVGSGRHNVAWVGSLLRDRDRTRAAATAGPQGLYLTGVTYPERFALPQDPAQDRPLLLHA